MANDIKTIESTAKIDESVSQGGFTGAAASIAAVNTTQNNIGMQVADGATMHLMDYIGADLGKNPRGNILTIPGIDYTERLQKSYSSQAQMTLGLQAQEAFNAANLEMQKKIALSPEDIVQFQQTMKDVIKDTTELAPTGARENLEASLMGELSNKVYQNNVRMSNEQRAREEDHNIAYYNGQKNAMIQANNLGNTADALAIKESQVKTLIEQLESQKISETTYQAKIEELDRKFQSSKITHELTEAAKNRGSGEVEKLISELPDKVPAGMKYADWISSAQEAVTNFKALETFRSTEASVLQSESFSRVVQYGSDLSQAEYENLQSKLSPVEFQTLRLKINSYLNPKSKGQDKVGNLVRQKDNGLAWGLETGKVQMGALVYMASKISDNATKRGSPISESEALAQAAAMTPIAVKGYTDYLSNAIASGDPHKAIENAVIIQSMKEQGYTGQRYQVDKTTEVAAAKILEKVNEPVPAAEAVAKARELIFTKSSKENLELVATYNDWKTKQTQQDMNDSRTYAIKQIGASDFNKSADHDALANQFYSLMKDYWVESKGDKQLATKLATDFIHRNYGISTINGKEQFVIHPPEQVLGQGLNGSKYVIVDDARNSIESQFKDLNDAYNEKFPDNPKKYKSDVRIEFKRPELNGKPVTFEGLRELYTQFSGEKDLSKARKLEKDYYAYRDAYIKGNDKIEAVAHYRDGHSAPLTAVLNSAPAVLQDGEQVGDWGVHFVDANGIPQAVQALSPYYSQRIFYSGQNPRLKQNIRDLGITPLNLDLYERQNENMLEFAARIKREQDRKSMSGN